MSYAWDPEQRQFLDAHRWAVLATGRRDGSPQQSMIGYAVDDEGRLLVTMPPQTAKWKNARRQPNVCVTVADGREHLVVYGAAEPVERDPERAALVATVFRAVIGADPPDPLPPDLEQRTVLRITPTKTLLQR
jgi:PPOX class probable F420-dependent enzyme